MFITICLKQQWKYGKILFIGIVWLYHERKKKLKTYYFYFKRQTWLCFFYIAYLTIQAILFIIIIMSTSPFCSFVFLIMSLLSLGLPLAALLENLTKKSLSSTLWIKLDMNSTSIMRLVEGKRREEELWQVGRNK